MNSPASSSESGSFGLLDLRIQRWIWSEGWTALRDIQEQAIPAIVNADQDVIISAATASGKTEAAFFPIISHLLRHEPSLGSVIYVSPLKALINDQWSRLSDLCASLEIPVIAWHGDIATSRKHRFLKDPRGVLLITPESLEALFVIRGASIPRLMSSVRYIVVDELHSFIGSERGKQLQSLLHRAEGAASRRIPRIALSATLGNMRLAADFLRPDAGVSVTLLNSTIYGQELKVAVRCYLDSDSRESTNSGCRSEIAQDLYRVLRGSNNLVFPNSRSLVETYSDLLRRFCERDGLPNEFWAHHGNLSRELREETEEALRSGSRPATAVCTSTLELGIDIGSVRSIAQIGPPPSVASLRQRLGRSGRRRGEPAILRCYCSEPLLTGDSSISDRLRESLVQTISMVRLLATGWFEPPLVNGLHASTFVQQVLSSIAERGGATAASLWSSLIDRGPFHRLEKEDFLSILRELGGKDLVIQYSAGLLLPGELGERLINQYDFYAAFTSDEEYRLTWNGRTLGKLPVSRPLLQDQRLIFGGRRWRVLSSDSSDKTIVVVPDAGGAPPSFDSSGAMVHDRVRQEMRVVLSGSDGVAFLTPTSSGLLAEARDYYRSASLGSVSLVSDGSSIGLLTWKGDWVNDALALLLSSVGLASWNEGILVRVRAAEASEVREALSRVVELGTPDPDKLRLNSATLLQEKWDWALPHSVLVKSFISTRMDFEGARRSATELAKPT
jgi:ATP-dependent Lhr-like helicase